MFPSVQFYLLAKHCHKRIRMFELDYVFGDLAEMDKIKQLGISIDKNLNFHSHVGYIRKK